MVLKDDLVGKVVVDPKVFGVATIVDTLPMVLEEERFQEFPQLDISIRLIDGKKQYVTSSPAGPVTMSRAEAYEKLDVAKDFDSRIKSNTLPQLKVAKDIAQEHFPEYLGVARAKYSQRLRQCLDGEMSVEQENELMEGFADAGVGALTNGRTRSYFKKTNKSMIGISRDCAIETLRAYANFEYFMRQGNTQGFEHAVTIARDYFPHLVQKASDALDQRIHTASGDQFWLEHAKPHSLDDYVIRG